MFIAAKRKTFRRCQIKSFVLFYAHTSVQCLPKTGPNHYTRWHAYMMWWCQLPLSERWCLISFKAIKKGVFCTQWFGLVEYVHNFLCTTLHKCPAKKGFGVWHSCNAVHCSKNCHMPQLYQASRLRTLLDPWARLQIVALATAMLTAC